VNFIYFFYIQSFAIGVAIAKSQYE